MTHTFGWVMTQADPQLARYASAQGKVRRTYARIPKRMLRSDELKLMLRFAMRS